MARSSQRTTYPNQFSNHRNNRQSLLWMMEQRRIAIHATPTRFVYLSILRWKDFLFGFCFVLDGIRRFE